MAGVGKGGADAVVEGRTLARATVESRVAMEWLRGGGRRASGVGAQGVKEEVFQLQSGPLTFREKTKR